MYKEERQKIILDLVDKTRNVKVSDLANKFKVSEMTIRRDLEVLEREGLIQKTYGGAIAAANLPINNEAHMYERMRLLATEKQRMANYIARLVTPGEMIFLGSGTTTTFVAKALSFRSDITVVTNALTVMEELATNAEMTVIGIGGFLRRNEYSFYGHFADAVLNDLRVDRVIMGMRGVHPEHGLTSDFPQEIHTDRKIIQTSDNVIIAADRTKIGYIASSVLAPLSAAKMIVTTAGVNETYVQLIREKAIRVEIV
ncbi:MAG: DeoR/GlpR family DNA-binding transcription regulator [Anaerolineaceae bacterium]|jgi:DeoR/GlpR family transcriptional regulator of sugar metabolism|nr:DeoR/GlpR family DNA-binding transcription regulator [Anaerolineaceae bacterium]